MGDLYLIINILLYGALFVLYCKYHKQVDCGTVLIGLYLFVAICNYIIYFSFRDSWDITLWPFLYLFVSFVLLSRPFFKKWNVSFVEDVSIIRSVAVVFIICVVCYLGFFGGTLLSNLTSGAWNSVYSEAQGENTYYTGFFDHTVMFLATYLQLPACIVLAYYLTLEKKERCLIFFLSLSLVLYAFMSTILSATRATIFVHSSAFVCSFLFFSKQISPVTKRKMKKALLSVCIPAVLLLGTVTFSRFDSSASDSFVYLSILYYFGHSMLVFNYGVVDTIQRYAGGTFFCRNFYDGIPGDAELGTHSDPLFTTIIGALYKDFGPWGTMLVSLVVPALIFLVIRKRKSVGIAELLVVFYYFTNLMTGVFYEVTSALGWIIVITFYLFIRFSRFLLKHLKSHK